MREQRAESKGACRPCPAAASCTSSATTRGCASGGARSVASAKPDGLRRVQTGADQQERQRRRRPAPTIGGPLRVAGQDDQRERHDRQAAELQQRSHPDIGHAPPAEHRTVGVGAKARPIARNGANTSGSETITATSHAGTPSSTIITRFSVPISSTTAMPTETWNSDSRSSRPSGNSGVAASANGRKRGPSSRPFAGDSFVPMTAHARTQLQRLGDVEAAGDPIGFAPAANPAGRLADQAADGSRARRPARSPARGRRAETAGRRHA